MRHLTFCLSLACGLVVLAGCYTMDPGAKKRSTYVATHPDLDSVKAQAILDGLIMVGMTQEMVTAAWGEPARTEKVEAEDVASRWIYGNAFVGGTITNLFFDDNDQLVRYEVNSASGHSASGGVQTAEQISRGAEATLSKEGSVRP